MNYKDIQNEIVTEKNSANSPEEKLTNIYHIYRDRTNFLIGQAKTEKAKEQAMEISQQVQKLVKKIYDEYSDKGLVPTEIEVLYSLEIF